MNDYSRSNNDTDSNTETWLLESFMKLPAACLMHKYKIWKLTSVGPQNVLNTVVFIVWVQFCAEFTHFTCGRRAQNVDRQHSMQDF